MNEFLKQAKRKWQTILVIIFLTTTLSFSVSAFLPAEYLSEVSILVIQKQTINKVDAFSAAKSAEYLSEILSQVIYSQSFLEDVLVAPFENKKTFSSNITERELEWKKTVETKKINNTGIVKIKVYAKTKLEAENTAQSVAWALSVRGHKYHGGGDWVKIVTIDGPSTSDIPVKPNLLLNTLLGLILGILASIVVVYFLPELNLVVFYSKSNKNKAILTKEKIVFDLKDHFGKNNQVFLNGGKLTGKMLKKALDYSPIDDYRPFIKKSSLFSEKNFAVEESVKVIEPEKELPLTEKKVPAPENLPIFQEEEMFIEKKEISKSEEGYISLEELKRAMEEKKLSQDANENLVEGEPTEEEVRNRLNKLLKGDM